LSWCEQGDGNENIQFDFNIDLGDIGGFGNMGDINLADMMKGAFGCGSLISSYLTDVVK